MDTMNENDDKPRCLECGADDVYLIDDEVCYHCDEEKYDDGFSTWR